MNPKSVPFPKSWPLCVRSIILQVISLANYVLIYTRSWCADSRLARVRLKADLDEARQEIALLREELRIKDERMERIPAHHRPHYTPTQRMAILEIKAACRLNASQTARRFLVKPTTISNWLKRIDEQGPKALIQLREPVNRFPDLVKVVTRRLKTLCPSLGKSQIAKLLARAGLHLGITTVERFLQEEDQQPVGDRVSNSEVVLEEQGRSIRADYPNHVWGVDLTIMPTVGGYWVPWSPRSMPNYWPFGWWLAFVIDHYSRRVIGFAVFKTHPTSGQVLNVLRRAISRAKAIPRHLICDQGSQFIAEDFKA